MAVFVQKFSPTGGAVKCLILICAVMCVTYANCESFQTSALGLPSLFFKKKPTEKPLFSEAEREFFRRLESLGGPVKIMEYRHWDDVKRAAWLAPTHSIFVIDGPWEVWLYFRDHGWELIPMRLDGKWIVRKRIGASA